jgi:hypothetical protein
MGKKDRTLWLAPGIIIGIVLILALIVMSKDCQPSSLYVSAICNDGSNDARGLNGLDILDHTEMDHFMVLEEAHLCADHGGVFKYRQRQVIY